MSGEPAYGAGADEGMAPASVEPPGPVTVPQGSLAGETGGLPSAVPVRGLTQHPEFLSTRGELHAEFRREVSAGSATESERTALDQKGGVGCEALSLVIKI